MMLMYLKKNEDNTLNKECANIEEEKEHSTSLWASRDNITNVQFEKPDDVIWKSITNFIDKDINTDKIEDSFEYLKESIDGKKIKGNEKQRRFGRNDDRGKGLFSIS